MRRNGNGGKGGNGDRGSIPRWVRTLFDRHEERMAEMESAREEARAEHEERMAKSEEQIGEWRRYVRAIEVVPLEGLHRATWRQRRTVG